MTTLSNQSDGAVTRFVEVKTDDAAGCWQGVQPASYPYRGVVGITKVSNNTASAAVASWLARTPGDTIPMDGPDTVTNNTDSNGTRDGT